MNGNVNGSPAGERKQSVIPASFAMVGITVLFSVISALPFLYFSFIVSSAALSYLCGVLKKPLFAPLAVALSFGAVYLISKDLLGAAQIASAVTVTAVIIIICFRFRPGLFKSSALLGAGAAAATGIFLALQLKAQYGSVAGGAEQIGRAFYESFSAQMSSYFANMSGGEFTVAENDVKELLSFAATLLPGVVAVLFQLIGAGVYYAAKLFYKIFRKKVEKSPNEYRIPESVVIFFAFSFILFLIFSPFESMRVAQLAALNLCIALSVPTLFDGVKRFVYKMKHPPEVALPDGRVVKRRPFLTLFAVGASAMLYPVFPVFIFIAYSVAGTVKEIIRSRKE